MNYLEFMLFAAGVAALAIFAVFYADSLRKYLVCRRKGSVGRAFSCRRKIRRSFMGILLSISFSMLFPLMAYKDFFRTRPLGFAIYLGVIILLLFWVVLLVLMDMRDLRRLLSDTDAFEVFSKTDNKDEKP